MILDEIRFIHKLSCYMFFPANVVWMLGQHVRRWPNIQTTLDQCLKFAWSFVRQWSVWRGPDFDHDKMTPRGWTGRVWEACRAMVLLVGKRTGHPGQGLSRWTHLPPLPEDKRQTRSSKHGTMSQCWFNVWPTSQTMNNNLTKISVSNCTWKVFFIFL